LEDYLDFLRQRNLPLWDRENIEAKKVRNLVYKINDNNDYNHYNNDNYYKIYNLYKSYLDNMEKAANAMVCLINQTNAMIDNKIKWLEQNMVKKDTMSFRQKWLMEQLKKEQRRNKEMDEWAKGLMKNKNDV